MIEYKKHYFGLDDDALEVPRPGGHDGVRLLPEGAEVGGTSRIGHFNSCGLKTLLEILGPSLGPSGDGKVTEEWHFETPFGVATLYDYKGDCCSIGGKASRRLNHQTKQREEREYAHSLVEYLNHLIKQHYDSKRK